MSNQDEVDELKRIIEEERERKRIAKNLSSRGTVARRKENGKTQAHYDRIRADPELYEKFKEKARIRVARHYSKNSENIRSRSNELFLARKEAEAGRPKPTTCEVCGRTDVIMFDHDHETGKFRGWLCKKCNSALGLAADSPEILEKLAVYVRTHKGG
jgi:hypothetical protein